MIFYTTVKPEVLRRRLYFGTALAFAGIGLLCYGGIFLPQPNLQQIGFPLFCLSLGLIACGLIPYRRLQRLETKPETLRLTENSLIYRGREFPLHNLHYYEKYFSYGLRSEEGHFPYFSERTLKEIAAAADF